MKQKNVKIIIGWEEWLALPSLELPHIKAKIDTGARTSALHAFDIEEFGQDGEVFIRFKVHPIARDRFITQECIAPFHDRRYVTSSNGHKEKRYVIKVPVEFGGNQFDTEITLTKRFGMSFRMLIGRNTLRQARFVVDPARAYLLGKPETLKESAPSS